MSPDALLPLGGDLAMGALRLLATLLTAFAVGLGLLLFGGGIALTLAELVGSLRERRQRPARRRGGAALERAHTRG